MSALAIAIILLLTYYGDNVGDFTISIDNNFSSNYALGLSESKDFENSSTILIASAYEKAAPIGNLHDYPTEVLPDEIIDWLSKEPADGNSNGTDYMAYTFYLKNCGSEMVNYDYFILIEEIVSHFDEAIRVMVVQKRNVDSSNAEVKQYLYAKEQSQNGINPYQPEIGTISFSSPTEVFNLREDNFYPGQVDRYSILIWLEGNDIDCTDKGDMSIKYGSIKFTMGFKLVKKFDE